MPRSTGAGIIILSKNLSSVLVVCGNPTQKWGFPKGHTESFDDSSLHTAIRECFEETNLTTDDYTVHGDSFKIPGAKSYKFYYAIANSSTLNTDYRCAEITDIRWYMIDELIRAEQDNGDMNLSLRNWIRNMKNHGAVSKLLPTES